MLSQKGLRVYILFFFCRRNKKVVDYSEFGDLEDDGKWDVLVHQEFEVIASYIKAYVKEA